MNGDLSEIREKAKKDLYFFCKHILGFSKMTEVPHKDLCLHILKKDKRKKLNLMPRNSFKSTVITVGYSLWRIARDPNVRILIASETQKNSIKYVREIKSHLESNEKFKALFGDMSKGSRNWRDNEFTVSSRTRFPKEPTVMASSLEKGTIVGLHFDLIHLDDVVSRNNVNHRSQIDKTLDYYKLLLSILDPVGKLIITGTRWSLEDLYGWILDPDSNERDQFDLFIRKAIGDDGRLLMPEVLTQVFLDEQKQTQGLSIFNAQYQNDPLSPDVAYFSIEDVQFYESCPKNLYYFISLDPAISGQKKSDYSGIIVNGVDYYNRWWIQEALQLKLKLHELIDLMFELTKKYQPMYALGMEKFALEQMLKQAMLEEMERRNYHIPLKEVGTDTRHSKEARIKSLQPKLQAKEVYLKKTHIDLYNQIIYYPQVRHDDLIDALKTQLKIVFPCDKKDDLPYTGPKLTVNEQKAWSPLTEISKSRKVSRKKWMVV